MNTGDKMERLGKSNYDTWSLVMESILKSKNLWNTIETLLAAVDDETKYQEAVGKLDSAKNEEAKAIMYIAMDREEIQKTGVCDTAMELWMKIKENHQGADVDQRNIALSDFLSFSYRKGEQITSFCGRFETALAKAEATGLTIDESTKFWAFRNSLPSDIKSMANYWMMANPDGKIASLITSIKLQYHLERRDKPEQKATAFLGENSGSKNNKFGRKFNNRSNARSVPECHYCGKRGHIVADCRKKASEKDQQAGQSAQKANHGRQKNNNERKFALNATEAAHNTQQWIVDSGASSHMTPTKSSLTHYEELSEPRTITFGDGKETCAIGKGKFEFRLGKEEGELRDVLWVPELYANLLSVSKAMQNGIAVEFKERQVYFTKNGSLLMKGNRCDAGLFTVNLKAANRGAVMAATTLEEWHRRYGHSSIDAIKQLVNKGAVVGLNLSTRKRDSCEDCVKGKQTRAAHPERSTVRGSEKSAVLHFDTCGPITTESLGGSKYFVLAIEEYSNYKLIEFVCSKSEIPNIVKKIINQVELESRRPVKMIQTDNGTEFVNSSLEIFLLDKGIIHEKSATYTPEQNGSVERANRTVIEGIRTLLCESKLPEELWAEAANTIVYTTNRLLGPRSKEKTRYELYWQRKPDVSNLIAFGTKALTQIPKQKRNGKLSGKTEELIMVGYTNRSNTYRFYDPIKGAITISCDVTFIDNSENEVNKVVKEEPIYLMDPLEENTSSQAGSETENCDIGNSNNGNESIEKAVAQDASTINSESSDSSEHDSYETTIDHNDAASDHSDETEIVNTTGNVVGITPEDDSSEADSPVVKTRALRSNSNVDNLTKPANVGKWFWNHANFALTTLDGEPSTLKEAMDSDVWPKWKTAMDEEMAALNKNGTWELVNKPINKKTIKSKWVYKVKMLPNGDIDRYKARLVAKGYSQIPNVDYKETFAPVASAITIRTLFALATQFDMELMQFDVKTAFLYGDLEETLYMDFPEGYDNPDNKVCRLIKSLYGLKQAPRQWNIKFNEFLTKFNLQRSNVDKCLYYNDNRSLVLAIYVDDGLVASSDKELLTRLINFLKANFEVKVMECESYLGFRIKRDRKKREMLVHQSDYAEKVLTRFGMIDCKPSSTPEEMGPVSADDQSLLPENYPFKDLVGSLLYLVTCTRPDIAHAVSMASRTGSPTMEHWMRLKRILRYLRSSMDIGIRFRWESNPQLIGYSDSDYANDVETRRSTTGYVIFYGGAPVAWRCQRQPIVTLSTTEAEYVSGCEMVKELLPIRETLIELRAITDKPIEVRIDNLSTVRIAKDDGGQKRTKHIDVRAKWLNEQVEKNVINVVHVNGNEQAADILTKPLLKTKFQTNRNMILSLLAMLTMMTTVCAKQLLRVDPVDFAPTSHVLLKDPEVWNVHLQYPNLCHILSTTMTDKGTSDWYNDCHATYTKIIDSVVACNGPDMSFSKQIKPKIVYPERSENLGLTKPYYIVAKDDTAETLTEPIGDSSDDGVKLIHKVSLFDTATEFYKNKFQNALVKSNLTESLARRFVTEPYLEKLNQTLLNLNEKLRKKSLRADFLVWGKHPFSYESEAKRAAVFNCTKLDEPNNIGFELSFVASKPAKEIQFFEATPFNFFNTTAQDALGRNNTCWMVYHGPRYIMVNKTNNCMTEVDIKVMSEDSDEIQYCESPTDNLKQFASRMWHKEFCTTKILPQKEKVQIKYTNGVVRIYCYPFNVTIDNESIECPDYVFESDSKHLHRIAGMEVLGTPNHTSLSGTNLHFLREIKSFLSIDNLNVHISNVKDKVTAVFADTQTKVSNLVSDLPGKVGNFTSNLGTSIKDGAVKIKDSLKTGFDQFLDKAWEYIQWAGIAVSVIAGGTLLLLAAPLLEVLFFMFKLLKVPYRKSADSFNRLRSRISRGAARQTTAYLNNARMKFSSERTKLLARQRFSKLV